jgi:hypothetical protein
MISKVLVNHAERTYFNDYEDIRSDTMCGVTNEKVLKAMDKLVRRYRKHWLCDCMFVENDDGSGWRLMYGYDPELFDKGVQEKSLRLRHYTNYRTGSWDTEENVSLTYAKQAIVGA